MCQGGISVLWKRWGGIPTEPQNQLLWAAPALLEPKAGVWGVLMGPPGTLQHSTEGPTVMEWSLAWLTLGRNARARGTHSPQADFPPASLPQPRQGRDSAWNSVSSPQLAQPTPVQC